MSTATSTKARKPSVSRADKMAALEALVAAREFDTEAEQYLHLLDKYSERNVQLILAQKPDAVEVKGYNQWLALDRQVRKGSVSIKILAPAGSNKEEKTPEEKEKFFFRLASVFDYSDTDPKA